MLVVEGSSSEWVKCSCYCTSTCSKGGSGCLLMGSCSVNQFCEFVVATTGVCIVDAGIVNFEHGFKFMLNGVLKVQCMQLLVVAWGHVFLSCID